MRARPADLALGLAAVALSVGYLQVAARIPDSLLSDAVGAGGLPRALGWAMGILGALLCLRALTFGKDASGAQPPRAPGEPLATRLRPHLRALGLLAILIGYVLLAPWLGYAVATGLLVAAAAAYAGAPLGRNLVLVSTLSAVTFWVLFVHVFGIAMPGSALFGRS